MTLRPKTASMESYSSCDSDSEWTLASSASVSSERGISTKKLTKGKTNVLRTLRQRELCGVGFHMTDFRRGLYSKVTTVGRHSPASEGSLGAVFNVEFSPRGHVVLAACEEKAIQVYDPQTHQCTKTVLNAHNDCVNCIKFLDDRLFATCSDDESVRLWDLRNLSTAIMNLCKHRAWVKSIEFDTSTQLLLTASFDDTVRMWDINRSADWPSQGEVIFRHNLVTRIKLAPDNSKLCLASHGHLVIVHNFDLKKFKEASNSFADDFPQSQPHQANAVNCVEEVYAWPQLPLLISSLQVFPDSNKLLSRYTTLDEQSEWLCVHNMQSVQKAANVSDRYSYFAMMSPSSFDSVDNISSTSSHSTSSNSDHEPSSCTTSPVFFSEGFAAGSDPSDLVHFSSLLSYSEEANVDNGIIKEPGISADGRVVCSPYGNGLRLINVEDDPVRAESPERVCELEELCFIIDKQSPVLTARFSPTQLLVASGSMDGAVIFYQPKLS